MKRFFLTMFGLMCSTIAASACEPTYTKVVCTETVWVEVKKSVPYQKDVTKYDHCGKPYRVTVTCYKDVTIKVPKTVTVVKFVKVCE